MADEKKVKIRNHEEAREVIEKRADAYEHIVGKASSLLQLIIGSLSIVAALAAAGLITEFTSTLFDQEGIGELTSGVVAGSVLSAFFVLLAAVICVLGMGTFLIQILANDKYPGVITSDRNASIRVIDGSDENEEQDKEAQNKDTVSADKDHIEYQTWLIEYACGETDESPLSEVQDTYRGSIFLGGFSILLLFVSVFLLSYLFDGMGGAVVLMNIIVVLLTLSFIISYLTLDEQEFPRRVTPGILVFMLSIFLILGMIASVVSVYHAVIS